jgi:hypothetical protein
MSASFTLVQTAQSIGSGSATFANPVAFGNLIVAFFGAYPNGYTFTYPTGVTDSQSNTYNFYSRSAGIATNENACSFLYAAMQIKGGSCTVTFNGWGTSPSSTLYSGPSVIVAEFEVPELYQIWGTGIALPGMSLESQLANSYSAADSSMKFRALSNNGSLGGADCSDTGTCILTMQPVGYNVARCSSNVVALALANQFLDVFLVGGNYNSGNPDSPYFTITNGTLINTTFEPTGGGALPAGCSGCLAYGDFPYLNGPVVADCDNPPNGTIGVAYGPSGAGHGIVASGGTPGYTFALVGGILPPGLGPINATTGVISGTPTTAGKFLFSIQVTDSIGGTAVVNCSIAICPPAGTGVSNSGWTG